MRRWLARLILVCILLISILIIKQGGTGETHAAEPCVDIRDRASCPGRLSVTDRIDRTAASRSRPDRHASGVGAIMAGDEVTGGIDDM